jgi:hypothetical protein
MRALSVISTTIGSELTLIIAQNAPASMRKILIMYICPSPNTLPRGMINVSLGMK